MCDKKPAPNVDIDIFNMAPVTKKIDPEIFSKKIIIPIRKKKKKQYYQRPVASVSEEDSALVNISTVPIKSKTKVNKKTNTVSNNSAPVNISTETKKSKCKFIESRSVCEDSTVSVPKKSRTKVKNNQLCIEDKDSWSPKFKKQKLDTNEIKFFDVVDIVIKPERESPESPIIDRKSIPIYFRDVCRICGKPGCNMVDIFGNRGLEMDLLGKIHTFLPIQVEEDDGFPMDVCGDCQSSLEQSWFLAETSRTVDCLLQEMKSSLQVAEDSAANAGDDSIESKEPFAYAIEEDEDDEDDIEIDPSSLLVVHLTPRLLPFKCDFCDEMMKSPKMSKRHYNLRHQKLLCDLCFNMFDKQSSLEHHYAVSHTYKCTVCSEKFVCSGPQKLELHNALKHPEICKPRVKRSPFDCRLCDEKFFSKLTVRNHYEMYHCKHMCIMCLSYYDNSKDLNHHIKKEKHDTVCSVCKKEFNSKGELNSHVISVHEKSSTMKTTTGCEFLFCQLCNKNSQSVNYLKRHYLDFHKMFLCIKCHFIFPTVEDINNHSLLEHGHKSAWCHKCVECDKYFDDAKQIEVHIEKVHKAQNNAACESCGKSFSNVKYLRDHIRLSHTPVIKDKTLRCHICDKNFKTKKGIQMHMNKHNDNRLLCQYCDSFFYDTHSLRKHIKTKHPND